MPKVSVIIPLYKSEKYIDTCLTSLATQTYKDFDIILVDDCSPDNSVNVAESVVRKIGMNNVTIIHNEKNLGPSKTRANGIAYSQSEYIAFCDSDDFFEKEHLQLMIEASDSYTNDIVFCSYNSVYSSGNKVMHDMVSKIKNSPKNEILAHGTDSLCCILVRRSILDGIDFPDIRNGEDMSIIPLIIARSEKFGYVDAPIYNYVYHENSLSKKPNPEIVNVLETSFAYIVTHLGNDYPMETEYLGIKNLLYGAMLNLLKTPKSIGKAKQFYESFSARYPNWRNNKYYRFLPKHKKIYLGVLSKRLFVGCRILSIFHRVLSK